MENMEYKILMQDKKLNAKAGFTQSHQAEREFNRLKDAIVNGFVELYHKGVLMARYDNTDTVDKWMGTTW